MQFKIKQISPKDYTGNIIFLYGTEVAERNLPLSKRELDFLKAAREQNADAVVAFDRLPYKLYVVNFDGERVPEQTQERLRRSADKVATLLREAKQTEAALTGEGVIPEEIVAFAEGLFLADYTFDRYKSEKHEVSSNPPLSAYAYGCGLVGSTRDGSSFHSRRSCDDGWTRRGSGWLRCVCGGGSWLWVQNALCSSAGCEGCSGTEGEARRGGRHGGTNGFGSRVPSAL